MSWNPALLSEEGSLENIGDSSTMSPQVPLITLKILCHHRLQCHQFSMIDVIEGESSIINNRRLILYVRHVHRHFGGQVLTPKKRHPSPKLFMKLRITRGCVPTSSPLVIHGTCMSTIQNIVFRGL